MDFAQASKEDLANQLAMLNHHPDISKKSVQFNLPTLKTRVIKGFSSADVGKDMGEKTKETIEPDLE